MRVSDFQKPDIFFQKPDILPGRRTGKRQNCVEAGAWYPLTRSPPSQVFQLFGISPEDPALIIVRMIFGFAGRGAEILGEELHGIAPGFEFFSPPPDGEPQEKTVEGVAPFPGKQPFGDAFERGSPVVDLAVEVDGRVGIGQEIVQPGVAVEEHPMG